MDLHSSQIQGFFSKPVDNLLAEPFKRSKDDMIDGTYSYLDAAEHLKRCEAKRVVIIATHGILSGDALKEIEECEAVDEIAVTNSYPMNEERRSTCHKLKVIDISGVLAEAIRRTHNGESISYLFSHVV
ncbi:hypothetical protein HK101_003059 [Irineochytrium annulatum]|nr:hypothetical protein HK101_003059 [Irineochytrium annulatum]